MEFPPVDIDSHWVHALRTQPSHKAEQRLSGPLPCPYDHKCKMFSTFEQLVDHTRAEHALEVQGLDDKQARVKVHDAVVRAR